MIINKNKSCERYFIYFSVIDMSPIPELKLSKCTLYTNGKFVTAIQK